MSSSQVQCDLKNTPRDIVAVVKSHAVLPWLGAWGVTGSGHRWYILKSYAPDNMRCWPVKVHIVTWKRCNLSEYNWAFHSKCMGQFSCFAYLEINRINPHILYPSEVESWVQACAMRSAASLQHQITILHTFYVNFDLRWACIPPCLCSEKMFKHVQLCSKMLDNVQQCSTIVTHVQKCSTMFKQVQQCSILLNNGQKCSNSQNGQPKKNV